MGVIAIPREFRPMVEVNLCERLPLPWLGVKGSASQILMSPEWVVPIWVILALLPLGFLRRRWRWLGSGIVLVPLLIYLVLPIPWVAAGLAAGLTHWVPEDRGQRAEAIVVLGRGARIGSWQVETVLDLWQQQRAPLIWASGRVDGPRIERQLQAKGLPDAAVMSEGCSQTTHENARCTATGLQSQDIDEIILVTDGPHMLRSWLTFRALGFTVIPHFALVPQQLRGYEFPLDEVREYLGLASYWALGRFQDHVETDPALCRPPIEPEFEEQSTSTPAT